MDGITGKHIPLNEATHTSMVQVGKHTAGDGGDAGSSPA